MKSGTDRIFFAEKARFHTEAGEECVIVERIWANADFPRGTDSEAFRIVIRSGGFQLDSKEGLFFLTAANWDHACEGLAALAEKADVGMDRIFTEHGQVSELESAAGTRNVVTVDQKFIDDPYRPPHLK